MGHEAGSGDGGDGLEHQGGDDQGIADGGAASREVRGDEAAFDDDVDPDAADDHRGGDVPTQTLAEEDDRQGHGDEGLGGDEESGVRRRRQGQPQELEGLVAAEAEQGDSGERCSVGASAGEEVAIADHQGGEHGGGDGEAQGVEGGEGHLVESCLAGDVAPRPENVAQGNDRQGDGPGTHHSMVHEADGPMPWWPSGTGGRRPVRGPLPGEGAPSATASRRRRGPVRVRRLEQGAGPRLSRDEEGGLLGRVHSAAVGSGQARRRLVRFLEYQAKEQFSRLGIAVPEGRLARTPEEAETAARDLLEGGATRVAVKAQVPIGGRGKAGGIAVVDSPEAARREAERILAMRIRGYPVRSVWCETGLDVAHEWYCGIALDRDRRRLVVILSAAGGMDIEEVAVERPEAIVKLWPDPFRGPQPFELRQLAFAALRQAPDLRPQAGRLVGQLVDVASRLHRLAIDLDAVTCEVNPLVLTTAGTLVAADGKLEVDENAEWRHRDLAERLASEAAGSDEGDDPYEVEARRRGLTYVHLPGGTIGCIGNGAGLAMNTLDLVKQMGGSPNNFLDIGGGANAEKVRAALELILLDPDVRGVFINIFGGITRCDEVARGIIQARDELHITKPLVVRMTGTNEEEGRRLLEEAGIVPATSAPEAARLIVELTRDPAVSGAR